MRLKALSLATFAVIASALPVLGVPMTYYGRKGEYTVDYEAGTYYGCVYGNGCIFLGKERKIGLSTWKNGAYTYSINDQTVQVYKNNSVIFQDYF